MLSIRLHADETSRARRGLSIVVDGVELIPSTASDAVLMPGLIDLLEALTVRGARAAQLSLDELGLELCLFRTRGTEVELRVVQLGAREASTRPPVLVEASELRAGLLACLKRAPPQGAADAKRLARAAAAVITALSPETPTVHELKFHEGGFGFRLVDELGRLRSWSSGERAALPALLCTGEVWLEHGPSTALPFVELHRQVAQLRALPVASVAPTCRVGLELCVQLAGHHRALARNPYVEALRARCIAALADVAPKKIHVAAQATSSPRAKAMSPLRSRGVPRRLTLAPRWSTPVAVGEPGARLVSFSGAIAVAAPHAMQAFSLRGRALFRRAGARGIAVGNGPEVICASPVATMAFAGAHPSAHWWRTWDGEALGPELWRLPASWLTRLSNEGLVAVDPATGSERWRFAPRGDITHVVHDERVVVACTTDGGLHGLDVTTGLPTFDVSAPLPITTAPVLHSARLTAVATRGARSLAIHLDLGPTPHVRWTRELELSRPAPPVVKGGLTFVAGEANGAAMVVCLSKRGELLWRHRVPLEAEGLHVVTWKTGVIATDARGGACLVAADGTTTWQVNGSLDTLETALAPAIARKLLVVAGPLVRIIEPDAGRVLGQLEAGPHLAALRVDHRFRLYTYTDPGLLQAWEPGTVLSVV